MQVSLCGLATSEMYVDCDISNKYTPTNDLLQDEKANAGDEEVVNTTGIQENEQKKLVSTFDK